MAEVVQFHHALGQTPGFHAFADTLRGAGHVVHTPDLFEGNVFGEIEDGIAYAEGVGFGEIMERGRAAAESLSATVVYLGFSLGVVPAQMLAQTRTDCRGAVFVYSCLPAEEFGEGWPTGLPVQIHGMDADPFFAGEGDIDAARAIVASSPQTAELFVYPGEGHLFADPSAPSYDAQAAALLTERVLDFLGRI